MGKYKARLLVARGRISDALDYLFYIISYIGNKNQSSAKLNKLIFISSRFYRVNDDFINGYIEYAEYSTISNRVTQSLIEFISELK